MSALRPPLRKSGLLVMLGLGLLAMISCDSVGQSQTQTDDMESAVRLDTVVANGTFAGKEGISTSGSYRIGRSGEDLVLVLAEDFKTEDGPDLYVVLSPQQPDAATGENVMEGSARRVRSLRALSGEQQYDLADDLNLQTFNAVAIQCVQFSHLYGAAEM